MAESIEYKHLKPKPGSNYRQLFINGRIRAEILYRETVGREPLTPAEVAREYGLPIEAVTEAIDYCRRNPELLDADRTREADRIKAAGRDRWPYAPRDARPRSMNLYLDDDSAKASLVKLLRTAGHQVVIPADVGLRGVSDPRYLIYAVEHQLVLLTRNHDDFEDLHLLVQATGGRHPGILVVRSDNDASRDMKDRDVARAIANLEGAGVPIENEFHILNHWR